jgi:WS/DGAT/MGAT family acyltransferase
VQQLSGQDAMFIYAETPRTPFHVGGFMTYDPTTAPGGTVSFDDILTQVEARLPVLPILRRRLVRVPLDLDHPYWVDDAGFDLEYHVRNIALPPPGDWKQLRAQAARLLARPLDHSRPLWEIYFVEGLNAIEGLPEGSYAVVLKLHHAAVDGVAGRELSGMLHTSTPELVRPDGTDSWVPEPQPSQLDLMSRAARNYLARPARLAGAVSRTIPALAKSGLRSGELRQKMKVPRTRFNGPIDSHRVVDGCDFELAEMKRIKSAIPGATINDVVLAVISGALRRYLSARGELPEESLVSMIPMSVRSDDQTQSGGNQVATLRATFATDVADPVERLTTIHASTEKAKAMNELMGARTLVEYSEFLPGALLGLGMRALLATGLSQRAAPMANVPVTNIPGPQSPMYLAGARFATTYGTPPLFEGTGLIHLVHSYCGRVFVSSWSCPSVLPDIEAYTDDIRASFDELSEAV